MTPQLIEFKFNLETIDLLTSMGRSEKQTTSEMEPLGFTSEQINFILNSRPLLSSVLLRLQLYYEKKIPDDKIRASLSVLNNASVNDLLDKMLLPPVNKPKSKTSFSTPPTPTEVEEDEEEECSSFELFYKTCVKMTNEPTDIVKTSDVYTAFTDWWSQTYETPVPDKNELKDFMTGKLGKSNKNTWSNVCLL
jgi:hypothetical protein